MTVPPITNWMQDVEAIAKADIKRLEGRFGRVCNTVMLMMIACVASFLMASLALFRSCR